MQPYMMIYGNIALCEPKRLQANQKDAHTKNAEMEMSKITKKKPLAEREKKTNSYDQGNASDSI